VGYLTDAGRWPATMTPRGFSPQYQGG
jgi:hypothetical protein